MFAKKFTKTLKNVFSTFFQNAILSFIPFLCNWIYSIIYSKILDTLGQKKIISTTVMRKISTGIGNVWKGRLAEPYFVLKIDQVRSRSYKIYFIEYFQSMLKYNGTILASLFHLGVKIYPGIFHRIGSWEQLWGTFCCKVALMQRFKLLNFNLIEENDIK